MAAEPNEHRPAVTGAARVAAARRTGPDGTVPGVLAYVVAIAVALVIVPLTHGRFDRLAQIRFARPWLFFVGVGIQIALELVPIPRARFDDLGLALLLASYVALLAFCVSNLRMRGMELIALGIALNAARHRARTWACPTASPTGCPARRR